MAEVTRRCQVVQVMIPRKKIWKLQMPLKVKIFWWRVLLLPAKEIYIGDTLSQQHSVRCVVRTEKL